MTINTNMKMYEKKVFLRKCIVNSTLRCFIILAQSKQKLELVNLKCVTYTQSETKSYPNTHHFNTVSIYQDIGVFHSVKYFGVIL